MTTIPFDDVVTETRPRIDILKVITDTFRHLKDSELTQAITDFAQHAPMRASSLLSLAWNNTRTMGLAVVNQFLTSCKDNLLHFVSHVGGAGGRAAKATQVVARGMKSPNLAKTKAYQAPVKAAAVAPPKPPSPGKM